MRQESKQRRGNMDFSQLHTYTPPLCVPDNTGYTYALSSSYSTTALEFEKEHQIAPVYESPKMSRRSLRLKNSSGQLGDESVVDYSFSQSSSSYSSSSTKRETRTPRSKKQQSSSRSLSLNQVATPRVALSFSAVNTPVRDSSEVQETSTAFDSSLHSSALDQSQLRQRNISTVITTTTTVLGHRGKSERDITSDNSSGVNGSCSAKSSKSHSTGVNGFLCKDCAHHSPTTGTLAAQTSSSTSSSLSSSRVQEASADILSSSSSPFTSIYTRDRSRRSKTGVLRSMSNSCMSYSKQTLASVVSLATLLCNSMLWVGSRAKSLSGKGASSLSSSAGQALSVSLSRLRLLKQSLVHRVMGHRAHGFEEQAAAHSSFCGSLNVKDLTTEDTSHLKFNGSLCDDCKGKQISETQTVTVLHTDCSRRKRLAGAIWSMLAFAGYYLLQPGYYVVNAAKAWGSIQPGYCVANTAQALGSGVGAVSQKAVSLFWVLFATPVNAGKGLLWFLARGWYYLVSLMSLLNVFFLTNLFKLWKLLLLLIPFLLLFALWWWGPSTAALLAYLPAINLTEWRPASPLTVLSNIMPARDSLSVSVPPAAPVTPVEYTPATPVSQAPSLTPPLTIAGVDLERLEQVERQLALLWSRVEQGDVKQAQQHGDILALYNSLKQQLHSETDRESLGLWVSSLLEQRLSVLQGELHKDSAQLAETAEQQKQQQEGHGLRLAELELLLKALAAKTEEVQQKQQHSEYEREKEKQAADATPISVGVQQDDHDALLAEVKRLETELGKIRADLQGVLGCKGKCEQLDTLQEALSAQVSSQISSEVSAQVRKELQALFYGRGNEEELPESLLLWLSQHYTKTPDLRAALAELELSILRNVSLQLELNKAQTMGEVQSRAQTIVQTVTGTVQHTATAEGITEEHVKVIVQNALKLFSQDRTGLVDYALESGGGSILSTRCSETYETKTALMSLFGLPLWYFSQSPRVVIQPDVYPGNCWAFKGSQGYLVIRLSMRILPSSFCVEHIPKTLSPTGNVTSAPRNFTVYGLDDEYQEEGILLGNYIYQEDGESLQTFPVKEPNEKAFQIIEVRVLSNWGHPEYTCLYRFRVHGEPRPQ